MEQRVTVKKILIKGKEMPKIFECKLCGCVFSSDMDGCYWINDVISSDCPNCGQRSPLANINTYENKNELFQIANTNGAEFTEKYGWDNMKLDNYEFPPHNKKWTDTTPKKNRND